MLTALMVVGSKMASMVTDNTLCGDSIPEMINFFESFASISSSKGQIIYFRILFVFLQKKLNTDQVLDKFTHAASLYPDSGK